MKENKKIVLKGQTYATPKTESVEIISQGVLCASVAVGSFGSSIKGLVSGSSAAGGSIRSWQ